MKLSRMLPLAALAALLATGLAIAEDKKYRRSKVGADLKKKVLSPNEDWTETDFTNAEMEFSNGKGLDFTGSNFDGANLLSGTYDGANFTRCNFNGAVLNATGVNDCNFTEADLHEVDLSKVVLHNARFINANLRNLKGIGIITKANFTGADLRGANLQDATYYEEAIFRKAKYDRLTRWPKGFDVEKSGAILVKEEPKPAPKPEPKKEPKPEPKPEPPPSKVGTELTYDKGRLLYTDAVTKEEATKLGDYLAKEIGFGKTPLAIQFNKSGKTVELRIPVQKGRDEDREYVAVCKQLAQMVAKDVFTDAPVEVHLCDNNLKTIKVVKAE